jgi:hypothetical protein
LFRNSVDFNVLEALGPVQACAGMVYLLVIKSCKKSLVLRMVQYALSNGGELYDVSEAFLRTEMVKVMRGAPL